jgi:hypothetical protein
MAEDWRWPLVIRLLRGAYEDGTAHFSDTFRPPRLNPVAGQVVLHWNGCSEEVARYLRTYQDRIITEHATLGLACILVQHRARMEITEVTNGGDGPDYWLGNKELVLEVSGRQACNLPGLLKEKATQLRKNPYEKDGYVCVADYAAREAHLVYYSFEV